MNRKKSRYTIGLSLAAASTAVVLAGCKREDPSWHTVTGSVCIEITQSTTGETEVIGSSEETSTVFMLGSHKSPETEYTEEPSTELCVEPYVESHVESSAEHSTVSSAGSSVESFEELSTAPSEVPSTELAEDMPTVSSAASAMEPPTEPLTEPPTEAPEPVIDRAMAEAAFYIQQEILEREAFALETKDFTGYPIQWSERLYGLCCQRVMEITLNFSHDGFQNMDAGAENIAMGVFDAQQVVDGWYRSDGHRRNMLGGWDYGAMAYYNGYWVAMFAQH